MVQAIGLKIVTDGISIEVKITLATSLIVLGQGIMTPNQPGSQDPVFQTPQPSQLQSEESQASVRERLAKEQGSETEVIDEHSSVDDTEPTDMGKLANQHLPIIDSPPG